MGLPATAPRNSTQCLWLSASTEVEIIGHDLAECRVDTQEQFDYSRKMEIQRATSALAALGQATRLAVFRLLIEAGPEGRIAGDIAESLGLPGATLSFHLKELSAVGLVHAESRGRFICYRADFDTMNDLVGFLTSNCCGGDVSRCKPSAAAPVRKSATKRAA